MFRQIFHSRIADAICDTLFICAASVLFSFISFVACDGIFRLYTIASFAAGFLLEQFSISYFFFRLIHALKRAFLRSKSAIQK